MIYSGTPISKIRLRPYLSDNGPQTIELVLMKIKNTINDEVTHATEQFSCSVIDGNAGKYRSVDNAGKAASNATSNIIILSESCFGLFCVSSEAMDTVFVISFYNPDSAIDIVVWAEKYLFTSNLSTKTKKHTCYNLNLECKLDL